MGVLEELQAINADTELTDEQKVRLFAARKADEWVTRIAGQLPITRTVAGETVTVNTIERVGRALRFTGIGGINDPATEDDTWTVQIVNPPILVADAAGLIVRTDDEGTTTRYRLDPIEALRQVFASLVRAT